MSRWKSRLTACLCGALFLSAGATQAAEPVKIRLSWVSVPSELTPYLFAKHGVARHEGVSYSPEAIHFAGTPTMITALAAGEIDFASLAFSSFGTAVLNAGMTDLRIVADEFQDGVEGYYTIEYMVLKDGPVKTIEDMKGKVAATNGIGSAVDMAVRSMLRKHHLEDKRDYTIIEANFPNMKSMLAERKVDLITAVGSFGRDPGLRAIARTLFTQREALGTTQMIMWTARAAFLEKNHAAVIDFLEDYLRLLHWYSEPANRAEAVEIIAEATKQPAANFAAWVFSTADYYRDPLGRPDLAALQRNLDTQHELGFLRSPLDVARYADLSYVEAAASRLKP